MPGAGDQSLPQMVILAGGQGTRLRSLAGDRPKALMPVAGRPFIDHQLHLLAANGAQRILLCLGVGAGQIAAHVGDGKAWGLSVSVAQENPEQLAGTGGALADALPLLDEAFGVLYGDSYLTANYRAAYAAFQEAGTRGLMTVFRNEDAWDKSNTRVAGNRVVFYSKSPPPGAADSIDYGLSFYRREAIEEFAGWERPFDLSVITQALVDAGDLAAHEVTERFYEIGKPEGWAELDALLINA